MKPHPQPETAHQSMRRVAEYMRDLALAKTESLHSTQYTIHTQYTTHNIPYTLHPTPHTLYPTPYILHPSPCTQHPTPYTLHPTPYTLHPTPYTLNRILNTVDAASGGVHARSGTHQGRKPRAGRLGGHAPNLRHPGEKRVALRRTLLLHKLIPNLPLVSTNRYQIYHRLVHIGTKFTTQIGYKFTGRSTCETWR